MKTYTIERQTEYDGDFVNFLLEEVPNISNMFGNKFDFVNAKLDQMLEKGVLLVCKINGKIVGVHLSYLIESVFDKNCRILQQQLFYVKPGSGRAAYYLFKKFIDIGKQEANHIITMLTSQTNIKPQTLEKIGFKELETLYRMET